MSALTLRGITKTFGTMPVLKGIDMEIESGEFTVLVGPSGCGKSTLLNIIAGLEPPTGGTVEIGGRVVNSVAPKDRNIAMVFQTYALYPSMTVRQNITFSLECRNVPKREREAAVARVAALLQIETLLGRKPSQLSGGQRQRVAMGRALVRDPLLFLFDEPLSNLDAKLRVEMRMEIKQLHQRIRSTNVYVTHDQIEAMTMATRIAVMHQGEVQQFADPDTVYNRPANLFVARFMGAPPMNTLPARIETAAGGVRAVVGKGEAAMTLSLPAACAMQAGREVVLGLRPECIAEEDRRFGHGGERVILELPVEMTEPTGAETIVLARLGGERTLARVSPDVRLQPGDRGRFALDMRRVCLFDPGTGALIA
ncbi:MAG: sn-glycerol-3-phosphate ABC transporter ATP-binding protein UgpC [Alphaproteobacteria bacterium]|nr:sn-glycerol-3-phosphate ABC transporter ATP-binding protein UgpC [Alphaproteobacteria bacterium]